MGRPGIGLAGFVNDQEDLDGVRWNGRTGW